MAEVFPDLSVIQGGRTSPRTPPQAVELEESILGGILLDPDAIERVASVLQPEHFYISGHSEIYRTALMLHARKQPTDLNAVAVALRDRGLLDKVGGATQLMHLLDATVSAVNIDHYAEVVIAKANRRRLFAICQEGCQLAYDGSADWEMVLDQIQQKVFNLSSSAVQTGLRNLSDIVVEQYAHIERVAAGEVLTGLKTGFYDLDGMLGGGLQPKKLLILAGRPGMGKSALAATIARNVAAQEKPVALFSLEMGSDEVAQRLWSSESGVCSARMAAGRLRPEDWAALQSTSVTLSDLPLLIDESQAITPAHIKAQCRRLKAERGELGLIIVDYLHLMLDGTDDEVRELGRITRACKLLARELDVPILLLSQLNRAVEGKQDKRPAMSDLRGSGSIEQDADAVLLIYREEYYKPDTVDRGIAEIIIGKNRGGPTGSVKLLFEPQFTRFRNLRQ